MKLKGYKCGCCGMWFRSSDEVQRKFDQDEGFGICPVCASEIEQENESEWARLEHLVGSALNETNRAKFYGYELAVRRGIILQMIDEGVVQFVIKRR